MIIFWLRKKRFGDHILDFNFTDLSIFLKRIVSAEYIGLDILNVNIA